jgi:hypothetical protein
VQSPFFKRLMAMRAVLRSGEWVGRACSYRNFVKRGDFVGLQQQRQDAETDLNSKIESATLEGKNRQPGRAETLSG